MILVNLVILLSHATFENLVDLVILINVLVLVNLAILVNIVTLDILVPV